MVYRPEEVANKVQRLLSDVETEVVEYKSGMRTESWTLGRPDWSPHVFDGGSAQGR